MHLVKIKNLNCQTSNRANCVDNPLPKPRATYCADSKKSGHLLSFIIIFFLITSSDSSLNAVSLCNLETIFMTTLNIGLLPSVNCVYSVFLFFAPINNVQGRRQFTAAKLFSARRLHTLAYNQVSLLPLCFYF